MIGNIRLESDRCYAISQVLDDLSQVSLVQTSCKLKREKKENPSVIYIRKGTYNSYVDEYYSKIVTEKKKIAIQYVRRARLAPWLIYVLLIDIMDPVETQPQYDADQYIANEIANIEDGINCIMHINICLNNTHQYGVTICISDTLN